MGKKRICLDPGHYGEKYNAGVVSGYYESATVWKLTQYEKEYLEQMGIEVLVTRSNINENPDLTARGKMAAGCDLFVSNHTNACGTEAVNRAVAIHFTDRNETLVDDQSREFAAQIAKVIQNTMGVDGYQIYSRLSDNDRDGNGKKDDNYYGVLNGSFLAGVPGVIAEHSFHTNTEACKWLMDDSNLRKLAKACAECMASFVGASVTVDTGIQAVEFANMADTDIVKRVGELCTADMKNTGILASVSAAQFILESGYGKSVLAQSGIVMVILGFAMGGRISHVSVGAVLMLFYLACISAVAYSLWGILLKHNPVSKVAIFGFTNPVFGVLLSAWWLGEGSSELGINALIALILVSIGILIVNVRTTAK